MSAPDPADCAEARERVGASVWGDGVIELGAAAWVMGGAVSSAPEPVMIRLETKKAKRAIPATAPLNTKVSGTGELVKKPHLSC